MVDGGLDVCCGLDLSLHASQRCRDETRPSRQLDRTLALTIPHTTLRTPPSLPHPPPNPRSGTNKPCPYCTVPPHSAITAINLPPPQLYPPHPHGQRRPLSFSAHRRLFKFKRSSCASRSRVQTTTSSTFHHLPLLITDAMTNVSQYNGKFFRATSPVENVLLLEMNRYAPIHPHIPVPD